MKNKLSILEWKKEIPHCEGIWLRQCAAKGVVNKHNVTKIILLDGKEILKTSWGWSGEQSLIDLADPKFEHKLKHFYWFGPIPLPPGSNVCNIIREGKNKPKLLT